MASVFIEGKSVCNGYAKATKILLDEVGIENIVAYGSAKGENHAWNKVKINNKWYNVDTTFGDSYYKDHNKNKLNIINYAYLCCDDEFINRTHTLNNMIDTEECNSIDNYYFVKHGLYFDEADYNKLKTIINKEESNNNKLVTIRISNDKIFDSMSNELFKNDKIYNLFSDNLEDIEYMTEKENLMITIKW